MFHNWSHKQLAVKQLWIKVFTILLLAMAWSTELVNRPSWHYSAISRPRPIHTQSHRHAKTLWMCVASVRTQECWDCWQFMSRHALRARTGALVNVTLPDGGVAMVTTVILEHSNIFNLRSQSLETWTCWRKQHSWVNSWTGIGIYYLWAKNRNRQPRGCHCKHAMAPLLRQ